MGLGVVDEDGCAGNISSHEERNHLQIADIDLCCKLDSC